MLGFLFDIALLAAAFYLGKMHERYGSVGKAARAIHDKAEQKAGEIAKDFDAKL